MSNKNLRDAKRNKNDEFYTLMQDIEAELKHYTHHFKDKTIYCNCDNPNKSNFVKYFINNFHKLDIKRLVASCYIKRDLDWYGEENPVRAVYMDYRGEGELSINQLRGDGDFRSFECIDLLKQADVVVTNPPFSLFRSFIKQLMKYEKKFLVIGNMGAIGYKENFKLFKENKLWFGINNVKDFNTPNEMKSVYAVWFTNLKIDKKLKPLILTKKYNPTDYPKYDNYDAINVDKVENIPYDYDGVMGVPITLLDKYNHNQFEILGADFDVENGYLKELKIEGWEGEIDKGYIDGERKYNRILIRKKEVIKNDV